MKTATKYISVENGLIALFFDTLFIEDYENIASEDIKLAVCEYGIEIQIKDLIVPIPEILLKHVSDRNNVFIYCGNYDNYEMQFVVSITISKEALLEAKGAYTFYKSQPITAPV